MGKRVITTIPVGKIGNEQPIQVISESWVSPELKLTVREPDDDPRTGKPTMEMTHISREEPAADLFETPAGYTVKERPDLLNSHIARGSSPVPDLETQQIAEARKDLGPVLGNDVAYKLAMEKIDPQEAEELAEQAVQIPKQHTADLDPKSAEVFSQMDTLSRYWNTLGWVYIRQGNLAKAETYTRAAWQLSPQGYFAAHLGRIGWLITPRHLNVGDVATHLLRKDWSRCVGSLRARDMTIAIAPPLRVPRKMGTDWPLMADLSRAETTPCAKYASSSLRGWETELAQARSRAGRAHAFSIMKPRSYAFDKTT